MADAEGWRGGWGWRPGDGDGDGKVAGVIFFGAGEELIPKCGGRMPNLLYTFLTPPTPKAVEPGSPGLLLFIPDFFERMFFDAMRRDAHARGGRAML